MEVYIELRKARRAGAGALTLVATATPGGHDVTLVEDCSCYHARGAPVWDAGPMAQPFRVLTAAAPWAQGEPTAFLSIRQKD